MSLPHFLDADPRLLTQIDGVNPDPKLHTTSIIVQPIIGIPMVVSSKLQINLIMQNTTYNPKISPFNDMTIPLFWMDLYIPALPNNLQILLTLILHIAPVLQTIVMSLLGIAGITCLLLSASAILWVLNQQPEDSNMFQRRDSADLRIPLSYGQYTTIRILPAIKKITSKTDLFN